MAILAILKLRHIERFSTMFLNYDLLARGWVPYGYVYPLAELTADVLMAAHARFVISHVAICPLRWGLVQSP